MAPNEGRNSGSANDPDRKAETGEPGKSGAGKDSEAQYGPPVPSVEGWLAQWTYDESSSAATQEIAPLEPNQPPESLTGPAPSPVVIPDKKNADSVLASSSAKPKTPAKTGSTAGASTTGGSLPSAQNDRLARRAKSRQEQQQRAQERRLEKQAKPIVPAITQEIGSINRSRRRFGMVVFALSAVLIGGLAFLSFQSSSDNDDIPSVGTLPVDESQAEGDGFEVAAEAPPQSVEDLARSTVRLLGLNDQMEPECVGSGVIVGDDGTILTNAHVVSKSETCPITMIGVAVSDSASSSAELRYRADVVAYSLELDLAVVKIVEKLGNSGAAIPQTFPVAQLGDSDNVALGDSIRILGYPTTGGDTITLTDGLVSGFSSQSGIGDRALIKTNASISAGNSGGMAVDAQGRVIGIPTRARATESGPAIDCRQVDTNNDGTVDDEDTCVPVGGFLNGIRPINLATALMSQTDLSKPVAVIEGEESPLSPLIDEPRFSIGTDEAGGNQAIRTATADDGEICLYFNWSGIPDGTDWSILWYLDGEQNKEFSYSNREWSWGSVGRNFWACFSSEEKLETGVYEVGFFLRDKLIFAEGIEITEAPREIFETDWVNDTGVEVCEFAFNPLGPSRQVGLNELVRGETIPVGEAHRFLIPSGKIVVEVRDCEGNILASDYEGIAIDQSDRFIIGLE